MVWMAMLVCPENGMVKQQYKAIAGYTNDIYRILSLLGEIKKESGQAIFPAANELQTIAISDNLRDLIRALWHTLFQKYPRRWVWKNNLHHLHKQGGEPWP